MLPGFPAMRHLTPFAVAAPALARRLPGYVARTQDKASRQGEVMGAPIVRHRRLILTVLAAACLAVVALGAASSAAAGAASPFAATAGTAPLSATPSSGSAAPAAAAESVLVVRRAVDHDALWLLSPADGTPTAAGDLPGFAWSAAVSPDGQNVAYLPENEAPRVWIGYGPLAPRTISLAGAGVKRIDSFCWIDGGRLLVAGVTSKSARIRADRLYLVNAATGKVRSFRDLQGAEPSFAATARKVAYLKFSVVSPVPDPNGSWPTVRESLKVLSLDHPGAGRTVWTEDNLAFAEYRVLFEPQVSADGGWFLTKQTGSDVRVTYDIRDRYGYPQVSVFTPALVAGAGWDATGRRTAFAGVTDDIGDVVGCVWVYDVDAGSLTRTARGLVPSAMIASLAWSASGQLVANSYVRDGGSTTRHNLVLPGDLSTCTDLGRGRLPVWVTP
jgi:hypothetical protein